MEESNSYDAEDATNIGILEHYPRKRRLARALRRESKMSKVFVVDSTKQPLDPVHPGRARLHLKAGKAAVYRRFPFTIILQRAVEQPVVQPLRLKIDPGSRTTGLALVNDAGGEVVWAAQLPRFRPKRPGCDYSVCARSSKRRRSSDRLRSVKTLSLCKGGLPMSEHNTSGSPQKWYDSGHASLCLLGRYLRQIGFFEPLEKRVHLEQKVLK